MASNYYDYAIKKEEKELDPVRSYNDIHSNPGFFSMTMETRKEEPFGPTRKKMHKLMIETGVLSINQASERGDIIAPLEIIMKCLHSVLIHHDKNNSNGPNCDPTAYPARKSVTKLASTDTSALMQLLFALFYGEPSYEVTEMMKKEK